MAWLPALAPRTEASDEQPNVVLLSLFDGTGFARVAVEWQRAASGTAWSRQDLLR